MPMYDPFQHVIGGIISVLNKPLHSAGDKNLTRAVT